MSQEKFHDRGRNEIRELVLASLLLALLALTLL